MMKGEKLLVFGFSETAKIIDRKPNFRRGFPKGNPVKTRWWKVKLQARLSRSQTQFLLTSVLNYFQ